MLQKSQRKMQELEKGLYDAKRQNEEIHRKLALQTGLVESFTKQMDAQQQQVLVAKQQQDAMMKTLASIQEMLQQGGERAAGFETPEARRWPFS